MPYSPPGQQVATTPGVLVDNGGTIVSVITGRAEGQTDPDGVTFRQLLTISGLHPGQVAPTMAQQQLAATDANMPRVSEDAIVTLINKGVIQKTDLPAPALEKIDGRRLLRNQGTL